MKKENALEIDQLTVTYEKTPVLWDLSFEVPVGTLVGLVGPNGAGKSTLLKTSLGLLRPVSGSVRFFGSTLNQVRHRVAYVPQRETVDWDFPVRVIDVVMMGRLNHVGLFRRLRKADRQAALRLLEEVGLQDYADRQIAQLSGGQQQRVFLARALLQGADLYLLDEPFAGIDAASQEIILKILDRLRDENKTVVVVHHDLGSVASHFDWVILLNVRLVGCGPVEEIMNDAMLKRTYGTDTALFDEVMQLATSKTKGRA